MLVGRLQAAWGGLAGARHGAADAGAIARRAIATFEEVNQFEASLRQGLLAFRVKGISRLKSLQTLDEFHVSEDTREEGLQLEALENLDKLQGALSVQHLASPLQTVIGAERARLNTKHLLHLELNFHCNCRRRIWRGEAEGAILNALKPHPDLESLSILRCYGATSTPTWLMSLPNLKRLTLYIRDLEDLPALGTLSFLESLDIQMTDKLQKVGVEFLGINRISSSSSSEVISFPKLKHLTFSYIEVWKEWEEVDSQNIRIMPCLSSLEVRGDPAQEEEDEELEEEE